jgi:hypothetical protein
MTITPVIVRKKNIYSLMSSESRIDITKDVGNDEKP